MSMNKKKSIDIFFLVFLICILHCAITRDINISFIFLIILIGIIYIKLYPKSIIEKNYRQLEILLPLFIDLEIKNKLPFTQGYAASPDFLYLIKDIIQKYKPKIILEAGSGVSTIIASYAMKKYSNGKIISLDHEEKYSENTKIEININNLDKYSTIIHAPLKKYNNGNIWYDIKGIKNIGEIDFFIIDGPPSKKSKNARYYALPLLIKKLKKGSIIILDDCKRKEEKHIISLWKKEFNCFEFEYIDNSKGAYIIKKTK